MGVGYGELTFELGQKYFKETPTVFNMSDNPIKRLG